MKALMIDTEPNSDLVQLAERDLEMSDHVLNYVSKQCLRKLLIWTPALASCIIPLTALCSGGGAVGEKRRTNNRGSYWHIWTPPRLFDCHNHQVDGEYINPTWPNI